MPQIGAVPPPVRNKRPAPPTLPAPGLMGWLDVFQNDPLGLLTRAREAGDLARFRAGPSYIHVVNHPDLIKHILLDNHRNYTKETRIIKQIKMFTGENIFTGEGDFWLGRRRLMQPAFHRQHLASFGKVVTQTLQELDQEWAAQTNRVLKIDEEMIRVTLKIVGRALFSVDLTGETRALGDAFGFATEDLFYRAQHPFYPPTQIPTRRNRRAKAVNRTVTQVMQKIIRERLAADETGAATERPDLLALLMRIKDPETGIGLTQEELEREIVTMVFAGHETTSNALTWAWYALSQNPQVEKELHNELDTVLNGRAPTTDDVPNLVYTRRVIDETLRLYPPAWAFGRETLKADALDGYAIPAKTVVIVSPYTMHRHPRFWNKPETFDPDRFLPERSDKRPRYAYLPFGGGPRLCIGQPFALTEATLLLAGLAQRYVLRLASGAIVRPKPNITLTVANGLPMTLEAR
ncbi:MAG: cytochrome P450 [Anaerolineae bacterium]|nr:cytochrome P450 [Anaerolineae bacterium]